MPESGERVVWEPYGYYKTKSNIAQFMRRFDIEQYDELLPRTEDDIAEFWDRVSRDVGIEWESEYTDVLDTSEGVPFADWFVGGELNATRTLLDKWVVKSPQRPAYVWQNESDESATLTYAELAKKTNKVANALRDWGIGPQDTVAIVSSLHPTAIVASLACLKVGATQTNVFAGYGQNAIKERLEDSGSRLVFITDGYYRNGTRLDLTEKVDRAIRDAPCVEAVVSYDNVGVDTAVTAVDEISWDTFVEGQATTAETTIVDAEHPALIAYSSGTTGKPKGTIQTHSSLLANGTKEAAYQFDLGPGDTFFWVTDFGWVVVPAWMIAGAQALGATTVLMEGAPMYPSEERILELVEEHSVTTLGMSPTGARKLRQVAPKPRSDFDLSSLRVLGSTGEPWDEDSWLWYFDRLGGGHLPIINDSGGTEACGGLLAPTPLTPLKPATLWGPAPGIPANVYDESGDPSNKGYLVVEAPFVGMTRSLTDGDERYLETYWDDFDSAWNQNDWVDIDDDGLWFIRGRSDDTLNVSGRRITSPAIEGIVKQHPGIDEIAVIGVADDAKGQVPVGLATMLDTHEPDDSVLLDEVNELIRDDLGAPFQLDQVHVVPGLPRTQTGKIPRNVLERAYAGECIDDTSTLDRGDVLDAIGELCRA